MMQAETCGKNSKKVAKKRCVETLLPHCNSSTIGSCEQPFAHVFATTVHCDQIRCKHKQQEQKHGPQGFSGPQGFRGEHGCPGPRGWQGMAGKLQGPQGKLGHQGKRGKHGCAGTQGNQGNNGQNGIPGPQGPIGEGGGSEGGQPGPQGPLGNEGLIGPQGEQGPDGLPGLGFAGPQGLRGDLGTQGPQGVPGIPGPEGGPPGPQGVQGARGQEGGPAGPQGLAGNNGDSGPQGPSGSGGGGGGGSDGTQLLFGTNNEMELKETEVLILPSNGDFLKHSETARMPWTLLLDDSSDITNDMAGACISDDLALLGVIRSLNPLGTFLYRSTNQGASFALMDSMRGWTCIACSSSNGSVIVAGAAADMLYVSTNSGGSFTPRALAQNWSSVCLSSTGLVGMACGTGSFMYTSEDTGLTWTPRAAAISWRKVVCSSSGAIGFACSDSALFLSLDFGHTWNFVGPTLSFASVSMSADGAVLFATTLSGDVYQSTNAGATFNITFQNVTDIAVSADHLKVLMLSTISASSSYSQDSGAHFLPNDVDTLFQRPLAMTTTGTHALGITQNAKLYMGATIAGNVVVFNSLVSDQAVTSKQLTGLSTSLPGRITSVDSILSAISKMETAREFPVGVSYHSNENIVTPIIALAQNTPTAVGFGLGSGAFVVSGTAQEFVVDTDSGIGTYVGLTTEKFLVTVGFSVRSASNTDNLFCRINSGGMAHARVTLSSNWQIGCFQQRILLAPGESVQLYCIQKTNVTSNVEFTAINYSVAHA